MSIVEIEIWDRGKSNKLGEGPLTTAFQLRPRERLNEAATWSFSAPAEDPRTSLLVLGREAYCYVWAGSVRLCIFGGEILQLDTRANGRGGHDYEVSGMGRLGDLNYTWIDELAIRDLAALSPQLVMQTQTGGANVGKPNMYDGNAATSDTVTLDGTASAEYFCNVFSPERIFNMAIDINTPNAANSTLVVQYYNRGNGWTQFSGLTDGTFSSPATMAVDGTLTWTDPTDMDDIILESRQGCWLRFYISNSGSITASINEITVSTWGRATNDVSDFVAASGISLALDSSYFSTTANGCYLFLRNCTALQGLRQIAETENGMFRIKAHDNAQISYLRSTPVTTNLYAVGPASPADGDGIPTNQMVVTGLQKFTDTRKQINRLYVFGAGNGPNRVTLAKATDSLPAGYSYSTSGSYIQHNASYSANPKTAGKTFAHIKGEGIEASEEIANTLLWAAYAELSNRLNAVEEIRMEVAHLSAVPRVGDEINIRYYKERTDDTAAVDVNGAYTVTQVEMSVENGVLLAFMVCSNVNRSPLEDGEEYLQMVEQVQRANFTPQPLTTDQLFGYRVPEVT